MADPAAAAPQHLRGEDRRHPGGHRPANRRPDRAAPVAQPDPRSAGPRVRAADQAEVVALAAGRPARLAAGLAVAALIAALIAAPGAAAKPPAIRAPEAIVIDAASGARLYPKRPHGRPASARTPQATTPLHALLTT